MRFLVFVAILLQTLLTVSGSDVPFEICESPVFKPDSVSLSPYPPKRRADFTFGFKGNINEAVPGGNVSYELYYVGTRRKVEDPRKEFIERDFCDLVTCPINTGSYEMSYTRYLRAKLPLGMYNLTFKAIAKNGRTLICILVPFRLVKNTADAGGVVVET